jgi:predicted extracellular nuclease
VRKSGLRLAVGLALVVGIAALGGVAPAPAADGGLVISQVYGGGGNSGASHTHDFIELYNPGSAPVVLTGLSLQYASATGTGNFGNNPAQLTELTGTILPHRYFLVQQASTAAVGSALPAPDQIDSTPINMSGSAGKVALVTGTTSLGCNGSAGQPCDAAALARIVDRIGYGNANFFEGSGAAPTLSNTTSAQRGNGGCDDTNDNAADFTAAATAPRNSGSQPKFCDADQAPRVSSHTPGRDASDVALNSNVEITFSEDVAAAGDWFSISCSATGAHAATATGGPQTYTLDPASDFGQNETCTVTVTGSAVSDTDANDPPDNMAADYTWSFTTVAPTLRIHEIQGATHLSPHAGERTSFVPGVVTAVRNNGFWMQDPMPDADDATSEGIFVFTSSAPTVAPGTAVTVSGLITEFRPGGASTDNLTTTELERVTVYPAGPGAAIAPKVVGTGGRVPPSTVIEDDASGSVESSGAFDPAQDGIDFYESLEAMLLQMNDALAVGPRNNFGETFVVGDNGANAGVRTSRGGILVRDIDPSPLGDYRSGDFNPERIQLDDVLAATPQMHVGDRIPGATVGVLSYDFGNFELLPLTAPVAVSGGIQRETTAAPRSNELSVATFNVENLDPSDAATIPRLARIVVENLRAPDLIGIEEMQDNTGATNDGTTDASLSWQAFIEAIVAVGGPRYDYRQIDPQNNQDGGQPGGNIRVGFLFRTDRGLRFVDRPGGDATTPTGVFRADGRAHLTLSPGRVDPLNPAWAATRKPLAGEFVWNDKTLIAIVNHFSSKGGDDPLFGRWQPPIRSTEDARHEQAASVNAFVDEILAAEQKANVVVLGDINDFEFSETTEILEDGGVLVSLMHTLPAAERYSYVFEGNSQVLDQILFSDNLMRGLGAYDVVHVNAEFADQASDHDPSVARTKVLGGGGGGA